MITAFQGEYRWLSNFWPSQVIFEGQTYPTVEHAYQAAKTLDYDARGFIKSCATPGEAKRASKNLVLRTDWEQVKVGIMESLLKQKFAWPALRDKLLVTKSEELVEGNTWNDTFWGVCRGKGQNTLGKLLMAIREELRG